MRIKYYLTFSGRSPIEEFLAELSQEIQGSFLDALILLEEGQSLSLPLSVESHFFGPGKSHLIGPPKLEFYLG